MQTIKEKRAQAQQALQKTAIHKKEEAVEWSIKKYNFLKKHPVHLAVYVFIMLLFIVWILRLCRRRRRRKAAARSKREGGFNRWDPRAGLAPTWSSTALPPTVKRACQRGDVPQVIQWLSSAGNVNARDTDGRTALHYAAASGHTELAKTLLEANALPDALDKLQETPLHAAAHAGSASAVRVLLDAGAQLSLRDNAGRTPLNAADDAGNFGCSRLIQRRERAISRGASSSARDVNLTQRRNDSV